MNEHPVVTVFTIDMNGSAVSRNLLYKISMVGSNVLLHFFIPDFLLPPNVQNPPVALHFKGK